MTTVTSVHFTLSSPGRCSGETPAHRQWHLLSSTQSTTGLWVSKNLGCLFSLLSFRFVMLYVMCLDVSMYTTRVPGTHGSQEGVRPPATVIRVTNSSVWLLEPKPGLQALLERGEPAIAPALVCVQTDLPKSCVWPTVSLHS